MNDYDLKLQKNNLKFQPLNKKMKKKIVKK